MTARTGAALVVSLDQVLFGAELGTTAIFRTAERPRPECPGGSAPEPGLSSIRPASGGVIPTDPPHRDISFQLISVPPNDAGRRQGTRVAPRQR